MLSRSNRRRPVIRLAVVLALLLLAGHAQTAWYTLLFTGFWLVFWLSGTDAAAHSHADREQPVETARSRLPVRLEPLLFFAAALAVALLVAAAQLLPTAELLLQSQRSGGVDEAFAMTYSFWPWRFLGLVAPGLFGSPVTGNYWGYGNFWEDAVYIGLIPILLALQAVRNHIRGGDRSGLVRFLTGVTIVSFLLALGSNTPVFPFLYRSVPTFDLFQAPTRFTLWAVACLALLAGIGAADWAAAHSSYARQRARRGSAAGIALIAAGAAVLIALPAITPTFGRAILITGVFATAAALFGTARTKGLRWRTAVLAVTALDLAIAGWGLNPAADLDLYRGRAEPAETTSEGRVYLPAGDIYGLTFEDYYRFDTFDIDLAGLRATLLPNLNLLEGIASANQFDPLEVGRYAGWIDVLESARPDLRDRILSESAVAVVGVRADGGRVVFRGLESAGRVAWYPCGELVDDRIQAINLVLSENDPSEAVIALELVENGEVTLCGEDGPSTGEIHVEITQAGSNHLRIETTSDRSGWLLVRDSYYPGWSATVDGEEDFVSPANAAFRAVPVPAGDHVVDLHYRPLSFYFGLLLSMVGLAVVFFAVRKPGETIP
jgi:hypothetical protein